MRIILSLLFSLGFLAGCDLRSPEEKLDAAMAETLRPATFDELVNERVVGMAVERYTRAVDGVTNEHGALIMPVECAYNANTLARRVSFTEAFAAMFHDLPGALTESSISGIPYAFGVERFWDWRKQSLETVRAVAVTR